MVIAIGSMVFSIVGGRLADKIGARIVALFGLVLLVVVSWLFSRVDLATPVWQLILLLAARGMCPGFTTQPLLAATMQDVHDPAEIAHGSTLTSMIRNLAGAVGTGLLVSLAQLWTSSSLRSLATGNPATKPLQAEAQMIGIHDTFLLSAALAIVAIILVLLLKGRKEREAGKAAVPSS